MSDLVRYIVAAEMLALMLSLTGLWGVYHEQVSIMPKTVRIAFGCYLYVLAGGASAVVLNALLQEQSTSGGLFLVLFVAPASVMTIVALVWSARRPAPSTHQIQVLRNAAVLAEKIEHLSHLEPCINPECTLIRQEFTELIEGRRKETVHKHSK